MADDISANVSGGLPLLAGTKDTKKIYKTLMQNLHGIKKDLPMDQAVAGCTYLYLDQIVELNHTANQPNLLNSRDRVQHSINQIPKGDTDKIRVFTGELNNYTGDINKLDGKRTDFLNKASQLEKELYDRLDYILKKLEKTPNASGSEEIINTLMNQWKNINSFRKERKLLDTELNRIQSNLDKLESLVSGGKPTRGGPSAPAGTLPANR